MPKNKRAAERATQNAIPIVLQDAEAIAPSLTALQASRLSRLYALSYWTASTIATLAYGVGR